MRHFAAVLTTVLLFSCLARAAQPRIEEATVNSQGHARHYYFYVPASVAGDSPAPLLFLLHGSGRNGRSLVESWRKLADREGIILVGPDAANPQAWTTGSDNPALLRDIIDDVGRKHPLDSHRFYIFGHSAGAQFGIALAALESSYFAAAALHAGALWPEEYAVLPLASRKIPIAIWSGNKDVLVPLDSVKATVAELQKQQFPVELHEMPGHDHNYYAVSDKVNEAAWEFLKSKRLEEQKFTEYQFPH